jgi:multidrug efflux pump subunit AcrA (membrane-fusion protein)
MSTGDYQRRSGSREPASPGDATDLAILRLIDSVQAVCRPGTETDRFLDELLRGFVSLANAHYGAFWAADEQSGELSIRAELMPKVSEEAARAWGNALGQLAVGVLQQGIIRYQAVPEPAGELLTGQNYIGLGFPVRGDQEVSGCATLVVRQGAPILSDAGIGMLRMLADFGLLFSSAKSAARFEAFYKSLSGGWELIGEVLAFGRPLEMAQVLAERARNEFGVSRVSVGFVTGEKVEVAAVSGEDTLDKRSNLVRMIKAAQTEVVVSGEPGFYDAEAEPEHRAELMTRNPQHEFLARASGTRVVYSVPLRMEGDLIGVWTLESGPGQELEDEVMRVVDVTAGQLGPLLHLAQQNARGPLRRGGDGLTAAARWVFGREHPGRKAAGVALILVLAFAVFGRIGFRVSATCRLTPSARRVYSAPFDTTIREADLRPGDTVEPGQLLVRFDREDLVLRMRETQSKLTSAEKQMSSYLAEQKMSQYAEAKAQRDALTAEVGLLQRWIDRTELRAEEGGLVISGDLTQELGRSVRMGEQLMEVAPLDTLILEVEVEQGDISYVTADHGGRFTTKADPDRPIAFEIGKIRPVPETRGGRSVYVAEAVITNKDGWLRPGMEGAAKVNVGRRNAVWVISRKLVDWVRLHIWW